MMSIYLIALVAVAAAALSGVASAAPSPLKVKGNRLVNDAGATVQLRGMDRSGTEYACIQGWGLSDGPVTAASFQVLKGWKANAVRIPLNEQCWLGLSNVNAAYRGANYVNFIKGMVSTIQSLDMYVILDLHWTAPNGQSATGQQMMPNTDNSPRFWTSVTQTFGKDRTIIFDLFNEPFPSTWECFLHGGTSCASAGFSVAGMQLLVTTVRNAGAQNVIMVGGMWWSNDLSKWLQYKPTDPLNQMAASWHSYNFNGANYQAAWESQLLPVMLQYPVITGEVGEDDCAAGYINYVLPWLDAHGGSYLAWAWNTAACNSPSLITSYTTGACTGFGCGYKAHLANPSPFVVPTAAPPAPPPPPPTPRPTPVPQPTQPTQKPQTPAPQQTQPTQKPPAPQTPQPPPTPATAANWASCSNVKAIPGNGNGVTDAQCAVCNNGAQTWYPCDDASLCYCGTGTVPPKYRLPYSSCSKAIAVPGNPNGAKDSDCLQCSGGSYRWYPCDQANVNVLCKCAPGYGTVTTSPPAAVAAQAIEDSALLASSASSSGTGSSATPSRTANTIEEFQVAAAPDCSSLDTSAMKSDVTCGLSYSQALCSSMSFYMAQAGGNVARGLDWRGTCFPNDSWNGRNLSLGWFDAGDYVKFGLPMAFSATSLAWGALRFSDGFVDPATRSALLYNLRVAGFYFLEAWDPKTQTLVAQLGNAEVDHESWTPCKSRTNEPRIAQVISPSCPGTEVAADTASAMAAIALVLQKYEGETSAALQGNLSTAAKQLFDFASGPSKGTYTTCVPGAYNSYPSWSGYQDELAFAATWMYELAQAGLTPDNNYLQLANAFWNGDASRLDWDNKNLGVVLRLFEFTGQQTYKNLLTATMATFINGNDRTAAGLVGGFNRWGSLREAANAGFAARYANMLGLDTDNQALLFAKRQLDYILGKNPAGRSYMVGFGTNPPINPHHRSAHDSPTGSISNPPNNAHVLLGALVGGPPSSDSDFFDDRTNYQTSEVTTDYNALMTGLIASFTNTPMVAALSEQLSATCASSYSPGSPLASATAAAAQGIAITPITLQPWYLQVKIAPAAGVTSVSFSYNDGMNTCSASGPQWAVPADGSAQWSCVVTGTPVGDGAIAVSVQRSGQPSNSTVVKEGAVALSLEVQTAVDSFWSPTFVQTAAQATGVTDVSRIAVTALTPSKSGAGSLVNFTIRPLPLQSYTGEGKAFFLADKTSTAFSGTQTTEVVYNAFGFSPSGVPNASSVTMQTLVTYAGVIPASIVIINNPTYIYYAAPPPDKSFAASPIGAALGGSFVTLLFFGGLFGGYKYAKRNKGKKQEQPRTIVMVVGADQLQRGLILEDGTHLAAQPMAQVHEGQCVAADAPSNCAA